MAKQNNHRSPPKTLSDHAIQPVVFPEIDKLFLTFQEPAFFNLTIRKRFRQINQTLCQLILQAPPHSFLLSAVLDFMDRVNHANLLHEPLDFASFEFWLNTFSELSESENNEIRAKIVGKYLPRDEYQIFFPIGMGKVYSGTHFITAHLSPDVDTMMASFWGWMDAFAARIGTGLHLWCLPGGPPDSPVTSLFRKMFGPGLFTSLARTTQTLTLTAMDLVTQKQFVKELGQTDVNRIDHSNHKAIILVNEQGHYLGDWRSSDVEIVRQIIILFKSCLHWFENNLHSNLITLLAKEDLSIHDLSLLHAPTFDVKMKDCEPAQDFNDQQKKDLNDFFSKVLGMKKGLEGTFRDLNEALAALSINGMLQFQKEVEALASSDIFDAEGRLKESRPIIFNYLKELFNHLDEAIFKVRTYVERLDVALDIKYKVLGYPPIYTHLRSDFDEIKQKMKHFDYLTVVIREQDGSLFPVGIVRERDLRRNGLGTVSLRDFCNFEEIRMASYLEVISVIDHHKSAIRTHSVPTAIIGDAQSCNVLIAELAFALNDRYSLGGMSEKQIEDQIQAIVSSLNSPSQTRIYLRLLKRRMAAKQKNGFYIHPEREFAEFFCFLQAILDDTDLLTKVSNRDVECVAQLLNRLKSISVGQEVEIIHFDDIPRDKKFVRTAAQRILQQPDMYSLYKQVYSYREAEVQTNLEACLKGEPSNIFLDTKEQNGCARVGQTKMFSSNFPSFLQHAQDLRTIWLAKSHEVTQEKPEIDLHLHMISTIASADEVYKNQIGPYTHQDELWFWVPAKHQGYNHLNSFLSGFHTGVKGLPELSLELQGAPHDELKKIFMHHFPEIKVAESTNEKGMPMAILRFKPGALNSRKSMVSPYLPRPIS